MTEPFLPLLNQNQNQVNVPIHGAWNYFDQVMFSFVANSMDLTGVSADKVSSIPNMWARPLLMDRVLRNSNHPLHQDFKAQWKGMLAAIALTEVESFQLKAELIQLPNEANTNNTFIDGLVTLIPSQDKSIYTLINQTNPWQKIYLFLYRGRVVGMTSPSTIVCPAQEVDWGEVPWFCNGKLESPLAAQTNNNQGIPEDCLNQDEKEQLWKWLDNLRETVQAQNNDYKASIIEIIDEFKQEIVDHYPQNRAFPQNINLRNSPNINYFGVLIEGGVLDILHTPIAAKPMPSSTKIKTTTTEPEFIFLPTNKEQLSKGLMKQPKDIWIYTTTNLVTFNVTEFKRTIQSQNFQTQNRGKIFIWEDELFLEEFYYIKGGNLLPGACLPEGANHINYNDGNNEEQSLTPLLPLNEKLLEYFSSEELTEKYLKLSPTNINGRPGIAIELTLPLEGGDYTITKSYEIKEKNAITQPPTLEIWPNFRAQGWQEYYVFYFNETTNTNSKTFKVHFANVSDNQTPVLRNNIELLEYNRLNDFPKFIRCLDDHKDSTKLLGLILLKTPQEVGNQNPNRTWVVGIDRGTSSTSVYYNINGTNESTLSVSHLAKKSNFLLQVTGKSDDDDPVRSTRLYEYFLFPKECSFPISTVLTTEGAKGDTKTILDGRIYIPEKMENFRPDNLIIHTNLKWSSEPREIAYQKLFLQHLALLITVEAAVNDVRKIQWAISYPSAFSPTDISDYQTIWNKIIGTTQPASGLNTTTGIEHTWKYQAHSESFALGHYFAQKVLQENIPRQTCIDMGGGTSDICIWYNNKLIHQCSVQLAGRDLFTQFLINKPDFLTRQFQPSLGEINNANKEAKIDAYLSTYGKELLNNNYETIKRDPDFEQIVKFSALGIAGLYYYIGLVLLSLNLTEDPSTEEPIYPIKKITPVFIGGNGSQILNWLNGGQFNQSCEANGLFSEMLNAGAGWKDPTKNTTENTTLSQHPKAEVAWGLVLNHGNTPLIIPKDNDGNDPIAGEKFFVNQKEFNDIDSVKLRGNITDFTISEELSNLDNFIKEFNTAIRDLNIKSIKPLYDIEEKSDMDTWLNIWNLTKQKTQGASLSLTGKAQNIRVEPPFIIGLKSLLKVLADELKADSGTKNPNN